MNFADLGLSDELLRAVTDAGYTEPTPIQQQAIPSVLMGKDLVGIAQTGTGKTAAFVLPMIDILGEGRTRALMPRSLILEPTRELAAQVAENFEKYGTHHKLSMALLIGGVQMGDQVKALEKGVDVLIATPGRLMDLFGRGKILLTGCSLLVIDEADRMLDMGFIPDIEEICTKLPKQRQTLLFSATMPPVIKKLADKFLDNPKRIEVARPASANVNIRQFVVQCAASDKRSVLRELLRAEEVTTAIVFSNRKTTVRDLNKSLQKSGFRSTEIHGDMEQSQRIAELERFKRGDVNILVASDVAARGLDVKGVSHVYNFDAPWHPDDYVHRIGRTGRGGATGIAYTLVTPEDAENISEIEKLTGHKIERVKLAGAKPAATPDEVEAEEAPKRSRGRRGAKPAPEQSAPAEGVETTQPEREPAPREERPRQDRTRDRAPRRDTPREERPRDARAERPRDERPREEQPRAPQREERARSEPRHEPRRRAESNDGPDDGWNGPVPDFLKYTLGA
ncbi:DEAD/DEAH box helicase [Sphingomonas hengshuiensis]|uniref:DEAD-box ATP-dependent RNA helicase RhpA n=1 Tax=Sphingomonas hengshuiensis TaxID=1609977 RepID=A0A7U4JA02_9SPHN|nr:DEAD/DEAH box helicase [Sphingomonas hengshuiensis]AJP72964.1 DEAD/DEAH box helicase [Sphingomonas hengshuiensis]